VRYEKVHEAGQVRDAAVLVASGITPEGERQVLDVSVALSEHESHSPRGCFALEHRRMIRTTSSLERVNKEICKRSRVVNVFPNEVSCLRLISVPLMEISERYCAGKALDC